MQEINYYISENYISDWTLEDAYREIYQNFIDYGKFDINNTTNKTVDNIIMSNDFEPESTDLLIIGNLIKR